MAAAGGGRDGVVRRRGDRAGAVSEGAGGGGGGNGGGGVGGRAERDLGQLPRDDAETEGQIIMLHFRGESRYCYQKRYLYRPNFIIVLLVFGFASFPWSSTNSVAEESPAITKYFVSLNVENGSHVFASWAHKDIPYTVVGNISAGLNANIDKMMKLLSEKSNRHLFRSNVGKIYMIYDSSVMDDLFNNPKRFISAGIPQQIISALRTAVLTGGARAKDCVGFLGEDKEGNITNFVMISRTTDLTCVNRFVYGSLGLSVTDDLDHFRSLCVLYIARELNIRDTSVMTDEFANKLAQCKPPDNN
jgi:hypothetical protein